MDFTSESEDETAALARRLAPLLKRGDAVFLRGTLGMGKSVFARALIRALCGDDGLDVPSPTFTIVQTYDSPAGTVAHFDLYRLEDPEELFELGWQEAHAEGIVIAEWPERAGGLAPSARLEVGFSGVDGRSQARRLTFSAYGKMQERLAVFAKAS